jgi:lipoprotein-releasing system permease protein
MLALQLAWRFLREGRTQSLLILAGVAIGVAAYVFITAVMTGVQDNLLAETLGTQAHLSVLDDDRTPRPLVREPDRVVLRAVEAPDAGRRPFDQWQRALARTEATPGIRVACPRISGAALAVRGEAEEAVEVVGADPARLSRIVDLPGHLVSGTARLGPGEALLGAELAAALGVRVGRPLRIRTDTGEARLRVVGTFALGQSSLDARWVVTTLRTGQTVLGRPGDISVIDVRIDDPFQADAIARVLSARTGQPVETWIDRNASLLSALSAQSQSTILIRVFTLLAVAMGIASVLAVSVVQRRGQIGILRAMGVRARVVLATFLWQGALLGVGGAVLGIGLGMLAGTGLERVVPFDIVVGPTMALTATGISVGTGLLAALLPARNAARMDPATAIRGQG